MKQETTTQKLRRGKPLTESGLAARLRRLLYPVLMVLTGSKVRYRVEAENSYEPLPGKPIIFAANHSAFPDTPILLRVIKRNSYVLIGRQNLAFIDRIFFLLNGAIWVDRRDREDMAACKEALTATLQKDRSILWFPEGTRNLTPSLLMLPMKWGIIDVARQAGAQIIPAALDYDREKMVCSVRFGEPLSGAALENRSEAIRTLRDTLASLRWELMCTQPLLHRSEICPDDLRKEMFRVLEEYPPLDWAYESSCIYDPHPYTPKK